MKVSKAIEILKLASNVVQSTLNPDLKDATKLGIEALERIAECRHADHTIAEDYLPGETPENEK